MTASLRSAASHDGSRTMARGKRVVAAVGPAGGTHALRAASHLARRLGHPLTVVSVVEMPMVFAFEHGELNPWTLDDLKNSRRALIADEVHRVRQLNADAPQPDIDVLVGEPAWAVTDAAREMKADVIVMGLGPHALRHRIFSNETALAASRRASCPVFAVHESMRGMPQYAVVAVDFSPESIHAARVALSLLGDGATLELVHVWSRTPTPYIMSAFAALDDAYLDTMPIRFARMQATLEPTRPVRITTSVREGEPADEILAAAREAGADLIVAGTRGIGALERLFLGSVSSALLRGAECSVLLAPLPDVVERSDLVRAMTGTSTDHEPKHWAAELEAFTRRNSHRRVALEVDDHSFGAQRQASGYRLVGATYDEHDCRVAMMFGGIGASHFTHTVGNVRSVAIAGAEVAKDDALCIESDSGRAILTFIDK